jgi:uncharacterized protein YutE (UPF0331/DUF86 family)
MTDRELVAKKLAVIETCVRELRTLARPAAIKVDDREERFVEHTLQIAIQAALDAASHIVSDGRYGEPRNNRELLGLLVKEGWLQVSLGEELQRMVGFRNILVHGYEVVDLDIVADVLENHLGDLLAFAETIRRRIDG